MNTRHRPESNRRRRLIQAAGAATASAGLGLIGAPAFAQAGRRIKLGYVAPITGQLASFGLGRIAGEHAAENMRR